jgi:hypothetical protein
LGADYQPGDLVIGLGDDRSGKGVSRRRAFWLLAAFGLAGCSEWEASQDRYIQKMKSDPMFTWAPPGNLKREVSYNVIGSGLERSGSSEIYITYTLPQPREVSVLVAAGRTAIAENGFIDGFKIIDPKYQMQARVFARVGNKGIALSLQAPIWI